MVFVLNGLNAPEHQGIDLIEDSFVEFRSCFQAALTRPTVRAVRPSYPVIAITAGMGFLILSGSTNGGSPAR